MQSFSLFRRGLEKLVASTDLNFPAGATSIPERAERPKLLLLLVAVLFFRSA